MENKKSTKVKLKTILPALTAGVGIVLMAMKIYADSEPGFIPLLLILLGTGWYTIAQLKK